MLLNVLSDKTDSRSRFVLIPKLDDLLAVKRLTNRLNSLLEALVREDRHRLVRGRRGPRKRASAFRDICQELGSLERISLLLKELVVESLLSGLLCLLAECTGPNLCLSRAKGILLGLSTQTGECLRSRRPHAVLGLSKASQLLGCPSAHTILLLGQSGLLGRLSGSLTKLLLTQGGKVLTNASLLAVLLLTDTGQSLTGTKPLSVNLLAEALLRLSSSHALRVTLLSKRRQLSGTLLEGSAISLRRTQAKLLLLLSRTQCLPITLVHEAGDGLAGSQVLLASQIGLRDATAITAKGTLRNLIAQKT